MGALIGGIFVFIGLLWVSDAIKAASGADKAKSDAAYWRAAYEGLVSQTGRDLNDGLGRDPRRKA